MMMQLRHAGEPKRKGWPGVTSSDQHAGGEANAFAAILTWSSDAPGWQRDALRRLCTQDRLEAADTDELLAVAKGERPIVPLEASNVRASSSNGVVTIGAIHQVANVNALALGERLSFGRTGLTVIYGDNGAGKSGYARILKQVCRARSPRNETILPNVYADQKGPPSAAIDFGVGGQNRSVVWSQGGATDPSLSAVSVFDSRTAGVHVENTNELAYTPRPLKILADLALACQDLKTRLNAEIKVIEARTPAAIASPACSPRTAVGQLIAGLSAATKSEEVDAQAGLDAEQTRRLEALNADLAADPARLARQLQTLRSKVEEAATRLERLRAASTDERFQALAAARRQLATASEAAALAASDRFGATPLPEVGGETWKALWEAARAYSQAAVYREQSFPVTSAGARCVLCQQELTPGAAERLTDFEAFVRDETGRRRDQAQQAYDALRRTISSARVTAGEIASLHRALRDDLGKAELAGRVRREALSGSWRLRTILREGSQSLPSQPTSSQLALEGLRGESRELATRAAALLTEKDSPARAKLLRERAELADRQWLSTMKADVLAQIDRLKSIATLKQVGKDTATNRITTLSSDLARALVTNRLRARFAQEVEKLGVSGLAIELQQARSSVGVPLFQVRLISKPNEAVGNILSEGEHRCVALAAFLAELATTDDASGIVFDDPVSSLDHMRRENVADRLAEEGLKRQVIVFTHDMAFLLLLDEACRGVNGRPPTPVTYRLVSRGADATGYCHQDPPANVMPLDSVIVSMRNHLANVSIHHARGDQANWHREVISFQDRLRTTWERAVEEAVSPVVKRLARKVNTSALAKVSVLTSADASAVGMAFARCSRLLHSQPGEINPPLPNPDAIEAEIDALANWIADIRRRQGNVA